MRERDLDNAIAKMLDAQNEINKIAKSRAYSVEMNQKHQDRVCIRHKQKTKKEFKVTNSLLRRCLFDETLAEII